MPAFLTATLYAPLASFGGLAVGERRISETRPTRSALIGLLGAALGVERADEAAQTALAAGYGFATQTLAAGRPMTDYHTAQMPGQKGKKRFATRAAELAVPKQDLNTVLTSRDYRVDAMFSLAIWVRENAPYILDDIAAAFRHPHYTLSLGRKSCPLGLPLAPVIADYPSARAALAARWTAFEKQEEELHRNLGAKPGIIAMDEADAKAQNESPQHIAFIRDNPVSRKRWQFALRAEAVSQPDQP
jgi:CRISPR system Cascade subunit CasD